MFRRIRKTVSIIILAAFITTSVKSPAYAQLTQQEMMPRLPTPGVLVHLSPEFTPAYLLGITIHPDNALQFDFLIHKGDQALEDDQKKEEYKKLVKYFLASLTIPDEDQWVNLSPYEKDRIIKDDFGKTEMGRDLLAEDYMLKQITSSLIYPEDGLGKKFWDKIYERAWKEYHTTNIPVNTFNKVWIVPDQAFVYESGNTAYILKSHLKVMLEEDYLSLEKHSGITSKVKTHSIGSQVIREIILPELEKEVNTGRNFANLRQMFSGMILATWYKKVLRESLLGKIYADKAKVKGVDQDPKTNEEIYQRYLKAFKKGVFNYIKDDVDKYTNETIPRKYFSGGFQKKDLALIVLTHKDSVSPYIDQATLADGADDTDRATISLVTNDEKRAGLGVGTVNKGMIAERMKDLNYLIDNLSGRDVKEFDEVEDSVEKHVFEIRSFGTYFVYTNVQDGVPVIKIIWSDGFSMDLKVVGLRFDQLSDWKNILRAVIKQESPAGIGAIFEQGQKAVQALENEATERIKAREVRDLIMGFLKRGGHLNALVLASALDHYFEDKLFVKLGLSSEKETVQVAGNEIQVLRIPVAAISPEPSVNDDKIQLLIDQIKQRIQVRYGLEGPEVKDAINAAAEFVHILNVDLGVNGIEKGSLISNIAGFIQSTTGNNFQLKTGGLAFRLENYFKSNFGVILGLPFDRQAIKFINRNVRVLGVDIINYSSGEPGVTRDKLEVFAGNLSKRIQERFGLDAAMTNGPGPILRIDSLPSVRGQIHAQTDKYVILDFDNDFAIADRDYREREILNLLRSVEGDFEEVILRRTLEGEISIGRVKVSTISVVRGVVYRDLNKLAETLAVRAGNMGVKTDQAMKTQVVMKGPGISSNEIARNILRGTTIVPGIFSALLIADYFKYHEKLLNYIGNGNLVHWTIAAVLSLGGGYVMKKIVDRWSIYLDRQARAVEIREVAVAFRIAAVQLLDENQKKQNTKISPKDISRVLKKSKEYNALGQASKGAVGGLLTILFGFPEVENDGSNHHLLILTEAVKAFEEGVVDDQFVDERYSYDSILNNLIDDMIALKGESFTYLRYHYNDRLAVNYAIQLMMIYLFDREIPLENKRIDQVAVLNVVRNVSIRLGQANKRIGPEDIATALNEYELGKSSRATAEDLLNYLFGVSTSNNDIRLEALDLLKSAVGNGVLERVISDTEEKMDYYAPASAKEQAALLMLSLINATATSSLLDEIIRAKLIRHEQNQRDNAQLTTRGGIDFNSANLAMVIKRDGSGVPLPLTQQDMAQLSRIQGFEPEIIEIRPAVNVPIINELQQKLQSSSI